MAINIQKGQNVTLAKSDGRKLTNIIVGLGWDAAEEKSGSGFFSRLFGGGSNKNEIDCDASVFVCKGGKLQSADDVVFFDSLKHKSGAIEHMGDNLTGDGEGDDEEIKVNLDKIPSEYDKLIFVVNIYKAVERKQNFGMLKNAFVRIVDADTNEELCRYNLSGGDYDGMLAMIAGEVYRYHDEWRFNAIGNGTKDAGLYELKKRFQ